VVVEEGQPGRSPHENSHLPRATPARTRRTASRLEATTELVAIIGYPHSI